MGKDFLYRPLIQSKEYLNIIQNIDKKNMPISIYGLEDSQKSYMICSIIRRKKGRHLVITYSEQQANKIFNDMQFFLDIPVLLFNQKQLSFYNIQAYSNDITSQRINVINRLIQDDNLVVVACISSILPRLSPPAYYKQFTITLENNMQIDRDDLIEKLVNAGYERVDIVEARGQFSVKGGIIDVFSLVADNPFRIEFFDDQIESIREFDVLSQRSTHILDSICISPAREILIPKDVIKYCARRTKDSLDKRLKSLNDMSKFEQAKQLKDKIIHYINKMNKGVYFENIENFVPFCFSSNNTLLDFFDGDQDYILLDEPSRIRQRAETYQQEFYEDVKQQLQKNAILPEQSELICKYDQLLVNLDKHMPIVLSTLPKQVADIRPRSTASFIMKHIPSFQGKLSLLADELKQLKQRNYRILVLTGTLKRANNLKDSLNNMGIESSVVQKSENVKFLQGQIVISPGSISRGFEFPDASVAIISDNEIFLVQKKSVFVKRKSKQKEKFDIFTQLSPGDYVVHETNGIGKYVGIKQLKVQNKIKDYLYIKYAGEDKLYVPTDQMHLIQKYVGEEGKKPKLSKLGSNEWNKIKSKVKKSVQQMAEQLLELYAKRSMIKGHAFQKDTEWQKQFEDMFPYEETQDQLQAIADVKRDMESDRPMDRLLCGDVGYGKTEVALRAAFKAVMDGKQVAMLVPTTVLAQQHYKTFKDRFSAFPFNIEMMSRFKTNSQQKEIAKQLKKGLIDIVIGTHRLLQSDIKYKDLGLLIIDEEQRFGVSHKEKIKKIRKNVDVLTLTATPIPRTLHMSLVGIRDMSVIENPPEGRYPVQTYVVEYDENLVRDSIMREISRGGQVFFVYNTVKSIDHMRSKLAKLLPGVKIAVAHGQMSEKQLENVMLSFSNREYDVLLCTVIIENGLDLQNVNTIIVYDADKLGLSQLYQLKGRVGRSNRLAYAYFTYRKDKILTEIAEKRLNAIKEFTEFGSGFKIAMRDLEIRGAGNILGVEQHGHIVSVGYDLYCKLLDQAVKKLKGEPVQKQLESTVDLDVNAYIDDNYIEDTRQKLEIYKKISSIENIHDKIEIQREIQDRFGSIPEATKNLINISYIRSIAQKLDVQSIVQKGEKFVVTFNSLDKLDRSVFAKAISKYRRKVLFQATNPPRIIIKDNRDGIDILESFLMDMVLN